MIGHHTEVIRSLALAGIVGLAISGSSLSGILVSAQQGPPQGQGAAQPAAGRGGAGRGARGGAGQGTPVPGPDGEVWGFTDTAFNPDTRWRIHDAGASAAADGHAGRNGQRPAALRLYRAVRWQRSVAVGESWTEWRRVSRDLASRATATSRLRAATFRLAQSFGDVQLHLEYAIPADVTGTSQDRGNGGVTFMGRYEIQILDSYNNRTYADGMMASIYGEWPPLVNVSRKPGEWQSLDIVFEAPRFTGRVTPGYFTIFWNGVVVQNRAELYGTTTPTMTPHVYTPHDPELPLQLQGRARVRYRNVWIRPPEALRPGREGQLDYANESTNFL